MGPVKRPTKAIAGKKRPPAAEPTPPAPTANPRRPRLVLLLISVVLTAAWILFLVAMVIAVHRSSG